MLGVIGLGDNIIKGRKPFVMQPMAVTSPHKCRVRRSNYEKISI
jgi:hypothetical protein